MNKSPSCIYSIHDRDSDRQHLPCCLDPDAACCNNSHCVASVTSLFQITVRRQEYLPNNHPPQHPRQRDLPFSHRETPNLIPMTKCWISLLYHINNNICIVQNDPIKYRHYWALHCIRRQSSSLFTF